MGNKNKCINDIFDLSEICKDRVQFWIQLINQNNFKRIAEIGVWKGEFAKEILAACASIESYTMIDPWRNLDNWNKPFNVDSELFEDVYAQAIAHTDFAKSKRLVIRNTTIEASKQIEDGSLDLAYIDGDHTLRGITLDLLSIYSKVKEGGIIAGDDFSLSPWQHDKRYEPTLIYPFALYFAEAKNIPIISLGENQFAMLKNPSLGYQFIDLTGDYSQTGLNSLR
jgi:hypothetical protein